MLHPRARYKNQYPLAMSRTNPASINMTSSELPAPFLKWAGGKRWLADHLRSHIEPIRGRYIEPFLGSGAVFFSLEPDEAILSDRNEELINTYKAITENPEKIAALLKEHQAKHCSDYYYRMRDYQPRCAFRQAARFIYLNRSCWNGLYRVNLSGKFNVPKGTKDAIILRTDDWERLSGTLKNATIVASDFEPIIERAHENDVIFADPPYTVKHNLNGFIKYNEALFSWTDQERLAAALKRATDRGARVFLTNANHRSVRSLYEDSFYISTRERTSVLSGNPSYRGKYQELLISSEHIWG